MRRSEILHYQINIWWSERDGAFLARMPELKGCIADGKTPEEAMVAVQELAAIWLELAREKGWAIPVPKPMEERAVA